MAAILINPGEPGDIHSIQLMTRTRWAIPNEQRRRRAPAAMQAARTMQLAFVESGRAELRALDSSYNCVGLVFANRRTEVDVKHVERILIEDEYVLRQSPDHGRVGDVAVYRDVERNICHVGMVAEAHPDFLGGPTKLRILSQWGRDGEYLHDADAVPSVYGRLTEIWTYRYGVD